MKLESKCVDGIMLAIAVVWVISMAMTYFGHGFAAMYLTPVIIAGHFLVGLAHKGKIKKKLLFYPFLAWLIVFVIGIIGMQYFTFLYGDEVPAFLILGLHPSYFFELACYWIGGLLTISLGIYKYRDEWLSEDEWDEFLAIAAAEDMDGMNQGVRDDE